MLTGRDATRSPNCTCVHDHAGSRTARVRPEQAVRRQCARTRCSRRRPGRGHGRTGRSIGAEPRPAELRADPSRSACTSCSTGLPRRGEMSAWRRVLHLGRRPPTDDRHRCRGVERQVRQVTLFERSHVFTLVAAADRRGDHRYLHHYLRSDPRSRPARPSWPWAVALPLAGGYSRGTG